jgi:hypothetical protein
MPVTFDPPSIKPELDASLERIKQRIQKALDAATQQLADNILQEGRSDISGAGNFGTRWTEGFTAEITGEGNVRTLTLRQAVPYWKVFQYGAIIHGKPLLWIPLQKGGPRARDFAGRLFRVNRKSGGVPLLMSADDKQVKYTGHESVRIPKKFHLVEIIRAESKTIGALFRAEMAG